jgi:thymidylate synthase (FAD)
MKHEGDEFTTRLYAGSEGAAGYVKLIETWGSDEQVIEAARMSTQKGFLGWGNEERAGDEKLLRYLWENKHHTPFEQCGLTFEVKLPICITREFQRHRTLSFNELSARYTEVPDEDYTPCVTNLVERSKPTTNKQKAGSQPMSSAGATLWIQELQDLQEMASKVYSRGLYTGVPREVARLALLMSRMSTMRVSGNLRNWFHFLGLRLDVGAQQEIRDAATAIMSYASQFFPRSAALFSEEALNG